jgi:hypothetical protein
MSQTLNNEPTTVKNLWKICQHTLITTPTLEHGTSASISVLRLLHYLSGDTCVPARGQRDRMGTVCTWDVSRVTSTKSPPVCMTTFSASLTKLTVLLSQSRDNSCYVSRRILAPLPLCINIPIYAHTTSRTVPTCDMNLGSLTRAPEAGDFVELLLLYTEAIYNRRRHLVHGIFHHVHAM